MQSKATGTFRPPRAHRMRAIVTATALVLAHAIAPHTLVAQGASTQTASSSAPAAAPAPAPASAATAPAAPAATLPITLFGEVRSRSELDRPGGALQSDAFSYLRSRFGVRIDPAPRTRIVLQVQDSRVLGAEGSSAATALATNVLELHQGYLELTTPWSTRSATFRVGRQEISLGNERLVGVSNWTNLGRSFDGARIVLAPSGARAGAEPWSATTFVAVVDERGRRFGPAPTVTTTSADHAMAGLFATRRMWNGSSLDGTLLYDAGARYRTFDASDRTTLDARLRVPSLGALPLRIELEGAYQTGSQTCRPAGSTAPDGVGQSVRAWLAGARIGTSASSPSAATATLGADLLSGDATPGDGRYSAFATMYATNHPFYGLMDVIGDPAATTRERGLTDLFASGAAPLIARASVKAELHRYEMAAGDDRSLGLEADLLAPVRLNNVASLDVGYGLFRAGSGAAAIGLGPTGTRRHWAFLQLGVAF